MKNEKQASVLTTTQYSENDLTLYNEKTLKAKKHSVNKKIFTNKKPSYIKSLSAYSSGSTSGFGTISYDLNTLNIDLNIRSNSSSLQTTTDETLEYENNTSERFQTLDTQYDFDCDYAKSSSEIHTVADMILKREFGLLT